MAEEAEGERLERIREAEEAAERAWISTIHGFCRRLLASHPAAAGLDPRFRVADEPEADRLATRAFDAALEELVAEGGAEALELAAANHKRTLIEMTSGAYDELRSRGQTEPALPEPPDGRPSRRARRADRGGASRARGVRGGERQGGGQPRADRGGDGAGPRRPADAELLDRLAGLKLDDDGQGVRGPRVRGLPRGAAARPGGRRRHGAGAGLRAAARAGQRLRPAPTRR